MTVTGVAQLNGGITTNNANINAGTGRVTASNILYSILPGSGITISGNKQNPTISATANGAVSSVQGTTGDVTFVNGTGISLDGLTINNTGVTSLQGTTGDVTFNRGKRDQYQRDDNHEYRFRFSTGHIQEFHSRRDDDQCSIKR